MEIETLYRRHITLVRGCARRVLGCSAAAEDVAHEVFVRFLEREHGRGLRPGEDNPAGYLFRSANHLALNRLRDSRRRGALEAEHLSAPPPADCMRLDERLTLLRILSSVEPALAQIAACHYLHGMEHEEIADVLGMQRRTVGRRLEKFREVARSFVSGDIQVVGDQEASDVG